MAEFYSHEDVRKFYTLKEELGRGMFSVVRRGIEKKRGKAVAVKIINKSNQYVKRQHLDTEVEILKKVDHPNVVKLEGLFETKTHLFLVMELVKGGELFDKIVDQGPQSERSSSQITRQILEGVKYLHSIGIVHRDLKPENILVIDSGDNGEVTCKITDFGLSKIVSPQGVMQTACGTPNYVAPEVLLAEGYDKEVDLWAVGVITYILLSGCWPFDADTAPQLYELIISGVYDFPEAEWKFISKDAKGLVSGLLTVDVASRLTVDEALEHPWIKEYNRASTSIIAGLADRFQKFNQTRQENRPVTATPATQKPEKPVEEVFAIDETSHVAEKEDSQDMWIDDRDSKVLVKIAKVQKYDKDAIVIQEGSVNRFFYRIKSGSCRVEKVGPNQKPLTLVTMNTNEMFGEISVLHPSGIVSASIIANEPGTELYLFDPKEMAQLFQSNPDVCKRFYRFLAIKQSQRVMESRKNLERLLKANQPADSPKKQQKKVEESDVNSSKLFYKTYGFDPKKEELEKVFACKWRGKVPHNGPVYVSSHYICFSLQIFAYTQRTVIPIKSILSLEKLSKNELKLVVASKDKQKKYILIFPSSQAAEEAKAFLSSKKDSVLAKESSADLLARTYAADAVDGGLTSYDWKALLKSARCVQYEKGQHIISQGDDSQKLYQVFKGRCRVELVRPEDDKLVVLGNIERNEIFGDISFLQSRGASASVVADEACDVYVIDGEYIRSLFEALDPGFAGRFFKHLAIVISMRLRKRETDQIKGC